MARRPPASWRSACIRTCSGVPHRISWLENVLDYIRGFADVKWWTGAQILDWYRQATRRRSCHAVSASALGDAVAEILKIVAQLLEGKPERKEPANAVRSELPLTPSRREECLDRRDKLAERLLHGVKRRRVLRPCSATAQRAESSVRPARLARAARAGGRRSAPAMVRRPRVRSSPSHCATETPCAPMGLDRTRSSDRSGAPGAPHRPRSSRAMPARTSSCSCVMRVRSPVLPRIASQSPSRSAR